MKGKRLAVPFKQDKLDRSWKFFKLLARRLDRTGAHFLPDAQNLHISGGAFTQVVGPTVIQHYNISGSLFNITNHIYGQNGEPLLSTMPSQQVHIVSLDNSSGDGAAWGAIEDVQMSDGILDNPGHLTFSSTRSLLPPPTGARGHYLRARSASWSERIWSTSNSESIKDIQMSDGVLDNPGMGGTIIERVATLTVTTGRTANASIARRKQEANFACTIPGCNSTFTRSFNLKGHLRSHSEQKPYKCHWPGCGKGFARQHDCKRHEQLHSNFRPFECDGCKEQFARMDALNRHLRSEAGAECAKVVEAARAAGTASGYTGASDQDTNTGQQLMDSVMGDAAAWDVIEDVQMFDGILDNPGKDGTIIEGVAKSTITTGKTASSSIMLQKQEARFACILLLPNQHRVSPYPSPNASPPVRCNELEDDGLGMGMSNMAMSGGMSIGVPGDLGGGLNLGLPGSGLLGAEIGEPPVSAGYSEEVAITGRRAYSRSRHDDGASSNGGRDDTSIGDGSAVEGVAKPAVTTGRTANKPIACRKQEARFACTIPGCSATFTYGFNLKRHLRSHFEQKPYKCHWPGCGKGFARQHDCKRHEQLHSNFRPFECDGCKKQFARMDALNRHLRSEAGAECAKVVEAARAAGTVSGNTRTSDKDPNIGQQLIDSALSDVIAW